MPVNSIIKPALFAIKMLLSLKYLSVDSLTPATFCMLSLSLSCANGCIMLKPPLGGLNFDVLPRIFIATPIKARIIPIEKVYK